MSGWLNLAWMFRCLPRRRAFRKATERVRGTQTGLLREILRANRDSWFGQRHDFRHIAHIRDFQQRVPLATFEDFRAAVERIARGEAGVLTTQPVRLLEPTSGTTRGEKLIPYTDGLRRQFQRAVAAWVGDLLWCRPGLRRGRAYWSISPAFGPPRRSPGGLPIGFDDDTAYLGGCEQWALRHLLVTPASVRHAPSVPAFQYMTLLSLLRAEDLTLISIWNPSFLTQLLAPLDTWQERLVRDVRRGSWTPPTECGAASWACDGVSAAPDPRRADRIASIVRHSSPSWERHEQLWPHLQLISCWTDAAAARGVSKLREWFADVEIQGKGLIATEACVTIPQCGLSAPALALQSAFFEFEPHGEFELYDESNSGGGEVGNPASVPCRTAWQLEAGGTYRVVVTTSGGLYRYRLQDAVRVESFWNGCPLLRFLGKADRVSDQVGEKLAEPHVRGAIDKSCAVAGVKPSFALLVPIPDQPPRYRLYAQAGDDGPSAENLQRLADALETELADNPHYRYAVQLGQLAAVEVHWLAPDAPDAGTTYQQACAARGSKLGDVKPAALDKATGWAEWFGAPCRATAARVAAARSRTPEGARPFRRDPQ